MSEGYGVVNPSVRTKVTVMMPEEMHSLLKVEAAVHGTTASKIVEDALQAWLVAHPVGSR